jgi:hypothetical protein
VLSLLACCKVPKNGYLTLSCQFFPLFVHIAFLNHTYHFPSFQGEQLLAMTYGYEAKGHHDRTIEAARKLSDIGTKASLPGSLLVNEFPFRKQNLSIYCTVILRKFRSVRHIPEWIPWISYWPLARIGHALAEQVKNDPMRFVRESMASSNLDI